MSRKKRRTVLESVLGKDLPKALNLKPGINEGIVSERVKEERWEVIKDTIQKYLPELASLVPAMKKKKLDSLNHHALDDLVITLHHSAFAETLSQDELLLMGMGIKYLAMCGCRVLIIADESDNPVREPIRVSETTEDLL